MKIRSGFNVEDCWMDEEGIGEGGRSVTSARLVQDALKTRWRKTPSPARCTKFSIWHHGFNVLAMLSCPRQFYTTWIDDIAKRIFQIEKVLSGVKVNVERSDTHLSPSRPEFVSCLKPTITHHFLDLNCTYISQNVIDLFPNLTMWFLCLNVTKSHCCFVPTLH